MEQQKCLKFILSPKMDTWWLNKGESKINILVVVNKVITLIRRSKETIEQGCPKKRTHQRNLRKDFDFCAPFVHDERCRKLNNRTWFSVFAKIRFVVIINETRWRW